MTTITLQVPDALANLPNAERASLFQAGLWQAIAMKREQLKREIAETHEQVMVFSNRYGLTFTSFEKELLPNLDSWQAHEDYNDWFFLQSVLEEKQSLLANLSQAGFI